MTDVKNLKIEDEQIATLIKSAEAALSQCDDPIEKSLLKMQIEALKISRNVLNSRIIMASEAKIDDMPADYFPLLPFGSAIVALNNGFIVRRVGWNGAGLYVFKQVPASIPGENIPKMVSLHDEAKKLVLSSTGKYISYHNQCLIYNRYTGEANSWVPSSSDMFAKDWMIVDPAHLDNLKTE
jgi:hypothetical protein